MSQLSEIEYPPVPGTYAIRNLNNFKVYVGSSKNIKRRIYQHKYELSRGTHRSLHLQNAFNELGMGSFSFVVLDMWSKYPLVEVEQIYLDRYQSYNRENGYNTQPIAYSNRNNPPSAETRLKISSYFKGKPKTTEQNRLNSLAHMGSKNPNYGKSLSPKAIKAIIEANILSRKKYSFISPTGKQVVFIGLAEFCRNNNLNSGSMCYVAQGKIAHHKGWRHQNSLHLKPKGYKKWITNL